MRATVTLRVARPTRHLSQAAAMYAAGLGLTRLSSFTDHDGFDGVILGHPGQSYHLEFTTKRGERPSSVPHRDPDDLLVFYVPLRAEWEIACRRMAAAGFREVSSVNPYWDVTGKTYEDMEGNRVVLCNETWSVDRSPGAEVARDRSRTPTHEPRVSDIGTVVSIDEESECEALNTFLTDRIYEYNTKVTGYVDGRLLAGYIVGDEGEIVAGYSGHTWGGCCELTNVWVHEYYRSRGFGRQLLLSAEAEAFARGCVQVVLATHSFQAPGFYERMGYERKYTIEGRPSEHADIIYGKLLVDVDAT